MEEQEFKPIAMVGTLPASDTSEIRFYVDEFKGYPYAAIRTFVKRENYAGPTKAGVTFNVESLEKVLAALAALPPEPQTIQDQELARVPRKAGVELVARVTIYKDSTGIDLREWVDEETYKGWSKKGVRLPYGDLPKIVAYLKEMLVLLKDRPKPVKAPPSRAPKSSPEES